MNVLLDTQAFLWLILDSKELSAKAKKIFLDGQNNFYLSLASLWEMAIKISLGKLSLHGESFEKFIPQQMSENKIQQLNIDFRHVVKVATLPFHHRDPFDRLIIAQGLQEDMTILTCDKAFTAYKVKSIW